jgi:hypothetical protein
MIVFPSLWLFTNYHHQHRTFPFGRGDRAVPIFRFDHPDAVIERLQAAGINMVGAVDVYSRVA